MKKLKIGILIIGALLVFGTIILKPQFSEQVAHAVVLLLGENQCSCEE